MNIYGHRGAAGEAPENTISGCLHAMQRGAMYLEVDLRVSADKKLVVIHDSRVNRTTDQRGLVTKFTAAELAKLDARRSGPPWPRKKDCGVPTLDALLSATADAKGYFLELKSTPGVSNEEFADLIARRFPTRSSAKKCVLISLELKLLLAVQEAAPHLTLGLVCSTGDVVRKLDEYKFEHLLLHWSNCNLISVMMIRRRGIKLSAWTVNDPKLISRLKRLKVDNVITDYPSMAVPLLASMERK